MSANATTTDPNPDLAVGEGDRPGWSQPDRRRRAFHSMHTVFRYSLGIRAPEVLRLRKVVDRRIGDLASVRRLTGTTYFSGMAVARGGDVLFERYAPDYDGQCVGHGGYGGQYMLANPDTGVVVVFFSVLENADAHDPAYSAEVIRMAEEITRLAP